MNVKTVADQLCDSEAGFASPSHPVHRLIEYVAVCLSLLRSPSRA